jgi:hypothetical protein
MSRGVTVAAGVGAAGALAYGAIKANWAAGGTFGLRGAAPWTTGEGGWAGVGGVARFVAFEGTVLLAVVATALLVALARPERHRLPRAPLAAAAWAGCLLVGGAWLVGTAGLVAGTVGPEADPTLAPVAFWSLWASFAALGGGFGATAWLSRPSR